MVDQDITGIGVLCSMTDEGSLILEVYDNSPAQAGGLAAGDLITAVDGTPIAGLALGGALRDAPGPDGHHG